MSNAVESLLARKRELLDIWNIREKLCLASAVACSGDQNWMSVSRSLKMICSDNQPHDWFAQKACAIQYGKLLENTETPKRKKRTERDSSTPVETPIESLVKRLTFERIAELKQAIADDQQEFAKLKDELACLQTADEAKVREMWQQIEMEKKQLENDQIARLKWLKERDVKKLELERSLRPALLFQGVRPQLQLKIKSEDMDIEENKPNQSGTPSPLLTSLLKSPSHSQAIMHPSRQAPTITNLLTAGSSTASPLTTIPPANTPANPPLFIPAAQLLNVSESVHIPVSQTAPTLSMLLDKKPSNSGFGDTADSFLFSLSTQQQLIDEGNNKEDDDDDLAVLDDLMTDALDNILDNNPDILTPELLDQVIEDSLKDDNGNVDMKEEMGDLEVKQDVGELQDDIAEQMEQMHNSIVVTDDLPELGTLEEADPSPENLESDELQETILVEQDLGLPEIEQAAETSQIPVNQVETQEVDKIEILDSEEDLPPKKIEEKPEPEPVAVIDPYEFDDTLDEQEIVKLHGEDKPSFVVEEKSRDSEEDVYEDAKETIVELPVEPLPPKEEVKLKVEIVEENLDTDDDMDTLAELQEEVKKESELLNKSFGRRKRSDSKKCDDSVREEEPIAVKRSTRSRRSDSSVVDDDSDTPLRTRRRCSLTPVTDYSVPNSPAGADDRDYKLWKKSILIAYNRLSNHKQAPQFLRPITEEQQPGYHAIVYRPMDLQTIKKNLENGTIRSTREFTRDVCLMISNAIMYNKKGSSAFAGAQEMWIEALLIIDSAMEQYKQPPGVASSCSSSSSSKEPGTEKSAIKRKSLRTQMI